MAGEEMETGFFLQALFQGLFRGHYMIQIHDIWLMPFNGYDFIPKWNFTRQRSNQLKTKGHEGR